MSKIKLPWRKYGDERPRPYNYRNAGADTVLVWFSRHRPPMPAEYWFKEEDIKGWFFLQPELRVYDTDSQVIWPTDRWIYLSEIENPFEGEVYNE